MTGARGRAYPRGRMAAPSRSRRRVPDAATDPIADPDGGSGSVHRLLTAAVDEVARLLEADGAMVYLWDPAAGRLRFAHDAGIEHAPSREAIRRISLAPGTGMIGRAVAERSVVATSDYVRDKAFRHEPGPDRVVADLGIRSMVAAPLVAGDEVFGALGAFSTRTDAFDAAQIALVRSLADHAAGAMANARLIEELDRSRHELDRSRGALARRADAERALREVAARITALRDPAEILQEVVELASRLVGGEGSILDLLDPGTGNLRWAYDDGIGRRFSDEERSKLWISVGEGATGRAVAEDRVVVAGDDLVSLFPPGPENTAFYERTGFRSMIAAPIRGEAGPLGVIEVYAVRPNAFDEEDGSLILALAGQAAIAITNARLIAELAESRAELARTAEAERTLRGIAARVSAILDPAEVLDRIVVEAARLLDSDGARIDLWDEARGGLRWAFTAGEAMADVPDWGETGLKPRQAVAGLAFAEQAPVMTEDFLTDTRFETTPEIEAFVRRAGIRAVISTPLIGESGEPIGVLSVVSREPGAYTDAEVEVLTALATHASIAITNANLMQALARSRSEVERRAEAERSLRQIAARITALREPDDVLQHVVDEAHRLLRADGAMIDQYDPETETLRWAYDAGLSDRQREAVQMTNLRLGEGVSGKAVAERRVIHVGDYHLGDFQHDELADSLVDRAGLRDLIAAPIVGEHGPLGAIEVMSLRPNAFDDFDAAVLGGLAEQAAIAITNARLIDELERSKAALARRAETERSLRDITARIAALRDPDEVLSRVVTEAKRLLGTDGAHLTRMAPDRLALIPEVIAGGSDEPTRAWLLGMRFPLGEGINGLAAQGGAPVWTAEYLTDPRIPHEPDDQEVAIRMGLCGMAAAPLRAPGGEVIGTLAVSTSEPRAFEADDLDLLQGLADQAAIALTNSDLLVRLTREEARFRGLVQTTPDLIWRADEQGVFTFMADAAQSLFGWPVEEIVGRHFEVLTAPASVPVAIEAYAAVGREPDRIERVQLTLMRRDGSTFAAEVTTTGVFEDGRWVGNQGTVRDVSERERLHRELRLSEERYRFLVQNAPDVIWSVGADARITFLSDAVERLTGFRPDELIGQHFGALVHESSREVAELDWTRTMGSPSEELRGRLNLRHRDGSPIPAEFIAVASLDRQERFAGANGSVRDMRERDRLERELRDSQERYRNLASSSPDLVFATDAEGRYTFLSDRASSTLGWDRASALGRPFPEFVAPGWEEAARDSYRAVLAEPTAVHTARIDFLDGSGRPIPLEINVVGSFKDGALAAIHGVARDVSERERLERELTRSEERYRFLIERSPDAVFATDAEGRFTFLSAAIERMTGIPTEELLGQHFSTIVDAPALQVAGGRWEALVANPDRETQASLVLKGRDGRRTPVDVRAVGITVDGAFAGIQGATRDNSDQVRLQAELRRQAGELAAGEERAHLARELHDSVTQALFSMTLVSRSVEMLLEPDPAAARDQLAQLRELQREALAEMRALIFELRPGNLEQDGLVRALKTHSSALQGRLGLPILVESDLAERLPLPVEEVLYRIAQEALHNVVKHASARQVRVELLRQDGGVRLRVEDDGRGFDPDAVPDGHLGLTGMRARADRLGARFTCTSAPGEGTTIEVAIDAATLSALAAAAEQAGRTPAPAEPSPLRDG